MTKKHEELVEEIGKLLEEYERTCADGHYGQAELDQCRQDLSIDAVAFTLSAVRDGGLELPGEAGRMIIPPGTVVGHIGAKWGDDVGILIALRREEER